jgi:hypothetical protein
MIAAVSSMGEFFFTVNQGKNTSATFLLFLFKLCQHLDSKNRYWRDDTVFMFDNAPYHKSKFSLQSFEELRLPVMYLGPY